MGLFGKGLKKEQPQSAAASKQPQEEKPPVPQNTEIENSVVKWSVQLEYLKTIDIEAGFIDHLGYSYDDVNIAGASYLDIDYESLRPTRVDLVPQPDNEFDKNAIAVKTDNINLGFVPKGNLQEMVIDYLSDDDRYVMAWLVDVDEQNKKLIMAMGFYKRERLEPTLEFTCKLTKTSKKDDFGIKRSENLECTSEGEELSIIQETDFDTFDESYIIMSSSGEIGELPKSAVSKLENAECDAESATAILEDADTGTIRLMAF